VFSVLLCCLFALVCCRVQRRDTYLEGAPAGDFDNWVFALEWEPEWIQTECSVSLLVDNFSPTSWGATNPSLHGLWPNYNATERGYTWPQYCKSDGYDYENCENDNYEASYCQITTETLSLFNVTSRWQKYAVEYSWDDLGPYEWSKHGSCSGYNQSYFYQVTENLYYNLSTGQGFAFLNQNVGKSVQYSALQAAFEKDTDGYRVVFQCDGCDFSEVWTAWDADPETLLPTTPIDCVDSDTCETCKEVTILKYTGCNNNRE